MHGRVAVGVAYAAARRADCLALLVSAARRGCSANSLPAGDQRGPILQNQLVQIMWAGELEGWITSPPKFHIVGDEQTADAWRNYVPSGFPVEAVPPPAMTDVVSRTARRAASDQPR